MPTLSSCTYLYHEACIIIVFNADSLNCFFHDQNSTGDVITQKEEELKRVYSNDVVSFYLEEVSRQRTSVYQIPLPP